MQISLPSSDWKHGVRKLDRDKSTNREQLAVDQFLKVDHARDLILNILYEVEGESYRLELSVY